MVDQSGCVAGGDIVGGDLVIYNDSKGKGWSDFGLRFYNPPKNFQLIYMDPRVKEWGGLKYQTEGSAAVDLYACVDGPTKIEFNKTTRINSGVRLWVRDPNYAAIVLPRSGLGSNHHVGLPHSLGLIDSDYQGDLLVPLTCRQESGYIVNPGDRIAQLMIIPVARPEFNVVEEFSAATDRGTGGFGSTNK